MFIRNKWCLFLVVAMGVFMSTMDSSMVNIALPAIMHEFQSPLSATEWVVLIYLLTITASLLLWGHLSDRLGRRRIYSLGMLIFAAGSFSCAYAPGIFWLICSRLFQGTGAAMMMSTGPAIIKETFPANQIGRGLGLIGVAVSLGLMAGPALGGMIIEYYSWRALFFITVPAGFVFSILAAAILPGGPRQDMQTSQKFDLSGALLWGFAITVLALSLSHAASPSRSYLLLGSGGCIVLAVMVLLVKLEGKRPYPLLPVKLFRRRFFNVAVITGVLSFMVLFSAIMLIPFYLDRVLGLPGSRIGLIMLGIPLAALITAPVAGWLFDHLGARLLTTCGLLLLAGGLVMLSNLTARSCPLSTAFKLALLGCGQAMFLSPNSASVLGRIKNNHSGAAAALLATARNLGMMMGIALASLLFSLYFSGITGGLDMKDFSVPQTPEFLRAMSFSFQCAAAAGFSAALISFFREGKR